MSDGMLASVRREVRRCQSAIDMGSPLDFWKRRLETWRKRLEACVAILRMQEEEVARRIAASVVVDEDDEP